MNKIHLLTVLGFLLLTSLSVHAFDVRSNQSVSIETQIECDSIYLSNRKVYAVKNLVLTEKEISFQFCEDLENRPQTAPWLRIDHIKKADGTLIDSPYKKKILPPVEKKEAPIQPKKKAEDFRPTPEELEKKVKNLFWIALISPFVFGAISILIVYALAHKYSNALSGHPKERQLRKKLKWAKRLMLALLILSCILMIIFWDQLLVLSLSIFLFIIGYR